MQETLIVTTVPPDGGLEAYRIVRAASAWDPELLDSFRSNYEQGKPPRHIEGRLAVVQMGLSMYLEGRQAGRTARRWPLIGTHVAEMQLDPGQGFSYAATGPPGHITVWGRPLQLQAAVVDIYPVEDLV